MPERYPAQNPRAAWRVYDGRAVIITPEDSRLHSLNEVGTLVWEAADGRTPVTEIVARVCGEFDVTAERAAADVDAFVEDLVGRGLLSVGTAPAGP
jgi:hypothetical protein